MAALEAIILYVQLTLGIANPTSTDIERASLTMDSGSTSYTYVTASPEKCATSSTGSWDINETN